MRTKIFVFFVVRSNARVLYTHMVLHKYLVIELNELSGNSRLRTEMLLSYFLRVSKI